MSTVTTHQHSGSYLMPALGRATVADAMHPGIVSCAPTATVSDVARLMATHHVHCIAAIGIEPDDTGERLVWKVISDFDLLSAGLASESEQLASEIVVRPMITIEPAMPLREAANLMLSRGSAHLVVVDAETQRPVGILSTLDVAGVLAWGDA
jgi:CBS domain-containing protein